MSPVLASPLHPPHLAPWHALVALDELNYHWQFGECMHWAWWVLVGGKKHNASWFPVVTSGHNHNLCLVITDASDVWGGGYFVPMAGARPRYLSHCHFRTTRLNRDGTLKHD